MSAYHIRKWDIDSVIIMLHFWRKIIFFWPKHTVIKFQWSPLRVGEHLSVYWICSWSQSNIEEIVLNALGICSALFSFTYSC